MPDLKAGRHDAYPCSEETHAIIGCAFEVLNELGHGLHEKLHENALCVEFRRRGIAYDQQRRFEVLCKAEPVGEFIPDLIALGKVVVDAKTIDRLTDHERDQMLNYLRITRLPVGLLPNFKHARLEFERVVLSTADGRGWTQIFRWLAEGMDRGTMHRSGSRPRWRCSFDLRPSASISG